MASTNLNGSYRTEKCELPLFVCTVWTVLVIVESKAFIGIYDSQDLCGYYPPLCSILLEFYRRLCAIVKRWWYSNWYYLLLLAFAGNSFVFLILDNIHVSTSVWLWIQVSSGQRGQFVLHHGCLSELLGPNPPRLTTLFPVLSSRTPGCSHWETPRNKGPSWM